MMIILFDSARVNPAPATFGDFIDPADWDRLAEDHMNQAAYEAGFLPL